MTIDDIFFAARDGNLPVLTSLLEANAVDINALLDSTDDGARVKLPMLYTLLAHMNQNGIRRDVLDLLVAHGLNVNAEVIVDRGRYVTTLPILTYAVEVWNNVAIAQYLLEKGANPCASKSIYDADTQHASNSPMLYFAISHPRGDEMLRLLLQYGADPNQYADVYDARGFYQYLPMIYYAMVEQQSMSKCTQLFLHGASPQITLVLHSGLTGKMDFKQYIHFNYPQLNNLLTESFQRAQELPAPAVRKVYTPPATRAPLRQGEAEANHFRPDSSAAPKVRSLRRCYGKFTAYMSGNFGVMALALLVIAPLIYLKKDPEMALIWFGFGIIPGLIELFIWLHVHKKAKASGQTGVMVQFFMDSVLMFARFLLLMTVILIPLALAIGSNIQWEERTTSSGGTVRVRKTGDGEYEDASGNRYHENN